MIHKLLIQGVEVMQAPQRFHQDGESLSARASYVVSMAQPKMGVVRWMLGRTFYPDNEWTRDNDGNPIRPYDMATDMMAEFMGVQSRSDEHNGQRRRCHAVDERRAAGGKGRERDRRSPSADDSTIPGARQTCSWRRARRSAGSNKAAGTLHVGDYLVRRREGRPACDDREDDRRRLHRNSGNTDAVSHAVRHSASRCISDTTAATWTKGGRAFSSRNSSQPYTQHFRSRTQGWKSQREVRRDRSARPTIQGRWLARGGGGAGAGRVRRRLAPELRAAVAVGAHASTAAGDPNPRGGGGNAVLGGPGGGRWWTRGGGGGGGRGGTDAARIPQRVRR